MFRLTSSVLALTAMTAPAFADVTPEQVWQSWVDYYESVGYSVAEGSRDKAGSTLTVRDVLIAGGTDAGSMSFKMPQVVLSDLGDGKVKTVFAESGDMDFAGTDPDGSTYSFPVAIKMPGNEIVTSGAPEDMTHAFNLPKVELAMTKMTNDGQDTPFPANLVLSGTTGNFHVVAGETRKYDYAMDSEQMTFDGDMVDDQQGKVKFTGKLDGLKSSGSMNAPGDFTNMEEEMDAALKAGLAMEGRFSAAGMSSSFDYSGTDENGQPSSGQGTLEGAGFDASFSMAKTGMGYQLTSNKIAFQLTSPQVPFPVSYGVDRGHLSLQLPVSQQAEPQPFHMAYALTGVTMAEDIWKMFDPQAALPRDPASLEVELNGLMKVTRDLFAMPDTLDETAPADNTDSATAEGVNPDAPADDDQATAETDAMQDDAEIEPSGFEPVEMRLDKFALSLLGAKAHATGELKAPPEGGIEAPVGQIHAEYEGVNKLVDTLGSIGLIPQDQMMGVRMMLALFAKPVEGETDKMVTELEFRDGGIFANGQQIK